MTIYLYTGTPGSGKSFHAIKDIVTKLKRSNKRGQNKQRISMSRVIANFPIAVERIKGIRAADFHYCDNSALTVEALVSFARCHHVIGIEDQTLVVIDEAQCIFNCRDWGTNSAKRMEWIKFFSQHRKLGYNFILISQMDKMIDKQIRGCIETEVAHRKVNNYFGPFLPFTLFVCISRWYNAKMKIGASWVKYNKKVAGLYDSYRMFDKSFMITPASLAVPCVRVGPAEREGTATHVA